MSKLNVQQLPSDYGLLSCFEAEPGHVLVYTDCYEASTEILTPSGWKKILDLEDTDLVWQVNPTTLSGGFIPPSHILKKEYEGPMHYFGNRRGGLSVTEGHTMLWVGQQNHPTRPDKKLLRYITKASDGVPTTGSHLAVATLSNSTSNHSDTEIWMACMIQADASLNKTVNNRYTYRIEVSKPEKVKKVRELLGKELHQKDPRGEQTLPVSYWYFKYQTDLVTEEKTFNLKNLGSDKVEVFVEALSHWDSCKLGYETGRFIYTSMIEDNVDEVQRYLVTSGYEATKRRSPTSGVYSLSIRKHAGIRLRKKEDHKIYPYKGLVGCVTVPSGFVLVRAQGQTFVCGNCTALEPHVLTEFSQDKKMLSLYGEGAKVNDIYLFFGANTQLFGAQIREHFDPDNPTKESLAAAKKAVGEVRQVLKIMVLGMGYGMGPKKLQEGVNLAGFKLSRFDAISVHDDYWRFFSGVKKFEAKLLDMYSTNRGYIVNGRGRPLAIHKDYTKDIVNRFVQSTGHDILMYYIMLLDRHRKAQNIPMRPWMVDEHDATVWAVPEEYAAQVEKLFLDTYDELNQILGWGVKFKGKIKIGGSLNVKCD